MSEKLIKQEIEVLPADNPKELKLGWTVSETIGIAIINPRGISGMKAVPRHFFQNENGSIEIRRYSIEIQGSVEAAALAFAEHILERGKSPVTPTDQWDYMGVIRATHQNGKYTVDLLEAGLGLIDPEVWAILKKDVEKICNSLTVFI